MLAFAYLYICGCRLNKAPPNKLGLLFWQSGNARTLNIFEVRSFNYLILKEKGVLK